MNPALLSRARGALLGLAVGDALGTTLEFRLPGSFEPIDDMVGGGPFHLEPGQWTDDTSMALCLAESLIVCDGFDPRDQMERYVLWWKEGHLSSTGEYFDIGGTISSALERFMRTGNPMSGSRDEWSAANGSLMRLAPVPIYFRSDLEKAVQMSGVSSMTTHALQVCVDACRVLGALIVAALSGREKDEILDPGGEHLEVARDDGLHRSIEAVSRGSYREKEPPLIRGDGFVVRSLEAALWAFDRSSSFREGCLLAANLGNDADTTAAIYGQLAGAHYGEEGIPEEWLAKLAMREEIASMATKLASHEDLEAGTVAPVARVFH